VKDTTTITIDISPIDTVQDDITNSVQYVPLFHAKLDCCPREIGRYEQELNVR
jgi:hypothetical protein